MTTQTHFTPAPQARGRHLDGLLAGPVPASAGIGLKPRHFKDILGNDTAIGWFEIHTENYMGCGGAAHAYLEDIRARYPLSCHGVGLSLGSADGLDPVHLDRVKQVVERYRPALVSEHLSWSVSGGTYLNDLLPLPLTQEALDVISRNVDEVQSCLGRTILVENPSSYLEFSANEMTEPVFLRRLIERTGCGLLLDVNNIYVSARNHGWDAGAYLDVIPHDAVGEIHLAGHSVREGDGWQLLIDDHGSRVPETVWSLFEQTLALTGPRPTLIEWDTDVPSLDVLMTEARRADALLEATALKTPEPLG